MLIHVRSFSDSVIKNSDLSDELKGLTLGLLQEAALRDDIVVLISNDPQQHVIKWLHNIDKNTVTVQERIIKIVSFWEIVRRYKLNCKNLKSFMCRLQQEAS